MEIDKSSRNRQHLLIPDPVAIELVERSKDVRVVASYQELYGFELYIVEQWACSRLDPTIAITTFTGQMQHKIQASVIEILCDHSDESIEVGSYLRLLSQRHTRRHETPLGQLLITNLSTFPSTLTILAVPGGNIKKHRSRFVVNENLKRLGCSGRAGINLTDPTEVTLARFRTLYKISDRREVGEAVLEMVKMCQIALSVFTKLETRFCDGLLCDPTQKGLSDWWTDIGFQHYNIEPNDGVLGPTTIAALLGLFLGARNRLHMYGAPVSKDAFDIRALKRGIAFFQKSQRLVKTRRLDHLTLQRLHRVTAKAVHHDGWAVPRAVKSTVAELGKGGEMVMGIVGVREKNLPADVETAEFDQFLRQISGDQCKWLWHGKRHKTLSSTNLVITSHVPQSLLDEKSSRTNWSSGATDDDEAWIEKHTWSKDSFNLSDARNVSDSASKDKEDGYTQKAFHLKSRRTGDSRRGLDRLREAVNSGLKTSASNTIIEAINKPDNINGDEATVRWRLQQSLVSNVREMSHPQVQNTGASKPIDGGNSKSLQSERTFWMQNAATSRPVIRGRVQSHGNLILGQESQANKFRSEHISYRPSFATNSANFGMSKMTTDLIMDTCMNTCLDYKPIAVRKVDNAIDQNCYPAGGMGELAATIYDDKGKYRQAFVEKSSGVIGIEKKYASSLTLLCTKVEIRRNENNQDAKLFDEIQLETYEVLKERLREVEALDARLEYELGVLISKIEEVEEGVVDLDRQVSDLESRSRSLEVDSQHHTWQHWTETLVRRVGIV